jgi:hypothetical protein
MQGLTRVGALISLALFFSAIAPIATATEIDLTTPEGNLGAFRKIQCSLKDGDPVTYYWHGRAYSRVPGEADRMLFRVEGMNIRQCGTVEDSEKGTGFVLRTREILLYLDPQSGEVLRNWDNPWTGDTVEVIHVANDPVNSGPFYSGKGTSRPFMMPFSRQNGRWWLTSTIPLFYTNPLAGDYQKYVGGTYHATEMFNFLGDEASLLDPETSSANTQVGWVRMSSWLPWMEMGDRTGIIYFHTAGLKLESYDQMSDTMKDEIAANFPEYSSPPPLSDDRRNETSWTYFKKVIEGKDTGQENISGGH